MLLCDRDGNPAGMVPIARLEATAGAAEMLRCGFDGAMPDRAPHKWIRVGSGGPKLTAAERLDLQTLAVYLDKTAQRDLAKTVRKSIGQLELNLEGAPS
jgi:hypothetical protein